jgi:mono/diheme cytochrome c family protein
VRGAVLAGVCAIAALTVRGLAEATPPTFARDVAPVISAACNACHRPGGSGPFSLLTYDDVRQHATQIVSVTKSRFMPPWKADPENGPFVGQRQLTDREIALIAEWVAAGAPAGDAGDAHRAPATTTVWQLGTPDLVVTLPTAFTLQAEATDVFRVFAIPLPIAGVRYVRGVEFLPGHPRVVHHANMRIDYSRATRRLDDADPAPGYDGTMPRSAMYPDGHFLGWTPGQTAPLVPPAFAWTLHPGADLVVQLHMQPSGAVESVRPSIGLYFGSDPPTATPVTLRLGDQGIDIPSGASRYTIRDSYVLPIDVELHALQPHSHYRAHDISGTATFPDGRTETLIHIGEWDFRWQHVYRYETPRTLPKGTRLAMEYTFDNSAANARNPDRPPRRVVWGQRTADEMGDLWFQLVPHNPRDRNALNAEAERKMTLEDVRGYETMLRVAPADAELRNDLALLYLGLGRTALAVEHFRRSVQLKPDSTAMRFNLATALSVGGQLDEAVAEYERVLTLDPAYLGAHNNLGSVLSARGDSLGALRHFREAVNLDPENVPAQRNFVRELVTVVARGLLLRP